MNLIEQLGGYEYLNEFYKRAVAHGFALTEIKDELLKHRRQHNIFEAGDKVIVLTNALGNKHTWIVESIDGIMVEISQVGQPNEWVHYSEIAHTTPEEIKAGHRL